MAAINILTDMFVLILPIRPALSLNINRKKKSKNSHYRPSQHHKLT
jgi:hypothetical protein